MIPGCLNECVEALRLLPKLRLDPFLEHVLPLEAFAKSWDTARLGTYLKTMIEVVGEDPAADIPLSTHRADDVVPATAEDRQMQMRPVAGVGD